MKYFLTSLVLLGMQMPFAQDSLSAMDFEKALKKYEEGKYKAALKIYDEDLYYTEEQYVFFANCANQRGDFNLEFEILSLGLERNSESRTDLYRDGNV